MLYFCGELRYEPLLVSHCALISHMQGTTRTYGRMQNKAAAQAVNVPGGGSGADNAYGISCVIQI